MFCTISKCDCCREPKAGVDCLAVMEYVCVRCGTVSRLCPDCRKRGCKICGGRMKDVWIIGSYDPLPPYGLMLEGVP
uniref:Uncharacterized protein n=1 Tax=Candidatus Methanomethylicus mesodigestus TaxID=1867258 RepID=A0A7C3ESS2_9CREN